jgi:PBP1b-binding outer membrane lipoprotein LpoB
MKNIYLALVSILLLASCEQEPASEKKIKSK